MASLAPGQRIMTTAGVFGTVVAIDADRVSVEIAPGVVIEMLAAAIAQVVPAAPEAPRSPTTPPAGPEPDDAAAGDRGATRRLPAAPTPEADRG